MISSATSLSFRAVTLIVMVGLVIWVLYRSDLRTQLVKSTPLVPAELKTVSDDGDAASFAEALEQSIRFYGSRHTQRFTIGQYIREGARLHADLVTVRGALQRLGFGAEFFQFLTSNFIFLRANHEAPLVTGYFLPELRGSRTRSETFSYPMYKRPPDLLTLGLAEFPQLQPVLKFFPSTTLRGRIDAGKFHPFPSRSEIDRNKALAGRGLEIVWVDSELDAFFMHIQGSGTVRLPEGSTVMLSYADKNGQPYRPIGAVLAREGRIAKGNVSMQSIKAYLQNNPAEMPRILDSNPSYVFFREVKEGPIGSAGVPLTPRRSVATDTALFPQGAMVFLKTTVPTFSPEGTINGTRAVSRFVFNHDTGGAIKGSGRLDYYLGAGDEAALVAGHLKNPGEFYFLLRP